MKNLLLLLLVIALSGCKTLIEQTYKLAHQISQIDVDARKDFNPGMQKQRIKRISIYDAQCNTSGYCQKKGDLELGASPKYPRGVTRSSRLQTIDFAYNDKGYLVSKKSVYLDFLSRDYITEHDIEYQYDEQRHIVTAFDKAKHPTSGSPKTSYQFFFVNGYPTKMVNTDNQIVEKEFSYDAGKLVKEISFNDVYQYRYSKGLVSQVILSDIKDFNSGKSGVEINISNMRYKPSNNNIVEATREVSITSYPSYDIEYKGVIGQSLTPVSAIYEGRGVTQMRHDENGFIRSYADTMFDYADFGLRHVIIEFEYEAEAGNAYLLDARRKSSDTDMEEILGLIYWR